LLLTTLELPRSRGIEKSSKIHSPLTAA